MQLLIGGDLVPTQSNINYFSNGDITTLLGDELLATWNAADIRIFNLEVPLTDDEDPISKCGPNLIAPTSTVKGIKALNPSLVSVANNHILDQGEQGLKSTEQILTKNEIPHVGIGDNLYEASQPYILECEGIRIGVYACAEHEFTIATATSAGANPFDPLESLDHIQNLKAMCDYVIVLYHGGKEHYRYPSPYLQRVCKKIADKGADLVVCQHSHCIGCYEQYGNSTIVYGQGNFLFDNSKSDFWTTSLLISLILCKNDVKIEYIPFIKYENTVKLAKKKQLDEILNAFKNRSKQILQPNFIEKEYAIFAESKFDRYLSELHGDSLIFKVCNKLLKRKLTKAMYSKKALIRIQNFIECEAHRELLLKGINQKLNREVKS